MKTIATLHEKIVQRERIDLANQHSTSIALLFFLAYSSFGIYVSYSVYASSGFDYPFLATAAFFFTGMLYLVSIIWKMIGSAYIKGEMLIVKYLFGKFKVTELRSIRAVKTVRIPGIRLTSIRFKIDGVSHKVLIFGSADYIDDPKMIIEAIRKVA